MEDTIPVSMVAGTSWLVTYVMPFPLSLWAVSTTLTYYFQVRSAGSLVITTSPSVVFTDANPSYTMNYTFPLSVTDSIRMWPSLSAGDISHFLSSYPTILKRTATNIFALAAFGSWLSIAPSVGTWQSDYPYSLTLTAGTTVDWLATGQTGSTDLFYRYVQSSIGFTIAARWSTSTNTSCAVDIVDSYETPTVRHGQTDRHNSNARRDSNKRSRWMCLLLALRVCMYVCARMD